MNTNLRKEEKNDLEKDLFKLMNNAVFGKTLENARNYRDIILVTTDKRKNQLLSEPNYHTTKWFSENLLAIEMRNTKVKMNKPVYLGLSILDISKTLMYELWYDYMKPTYGDNADDVQKRFDTSNYQCNRPLTTGKNKKVIGLMKDELGGKLMTEFVALRSKTYAYLMDDTHVTKKVKVTKKCVIK